MVGAAGHHVSLRCTVGFRAADVVGGQQSHPLRRHLHRASSRCRGLLNRLAGADLHPGLAQILLPQWRHRAQPESGAALSAAATAVLESVAGVPGPAALTVPGVHGQMKDRSCVAKSNTQACERRCA